MTPSNHEWDKALEHVKKLYKDLGEQIEALEGPDDPFNFGQ
jgi:hypothetical protein